MMLTLLRRGTVLNSHSQLRVCLLCSRASTMINNEVKREVASTDYSSRSYLSPLFSDNTPQLSPYDIEVVDNDTWQVSLGLANSWRGFGKVSETRAVTRGGVDRDVDSDCPTTEVDPDLDEIDNMRIHRNLFYKIDRGSKEFEEYNYDFHRRKVHEKKGSEKKEPPKTKGDFRESKLKEKTSAKSASGGVVRSSVNGSPGRMEISSAGEKRVRTPTYNQLTGPYHEPFCLDIYISKGSVRACVIHRATSKVVTVAHSISKDMKFDLASSTRNASACAAVGEILAQRALADDIHNAIYTPRKGEKLDGKLHIVLESIIDHGLNVKVKLKQKRPKKASMKPSIT